MTRDQYSDEDRFDLAREVDPDDAAAPRRGIAPGKVTLTMRAYQELPQPARHPTGSNTVFRSSESETPTEAPADPLAVARRGFTGAGRGVPYLADMESSFGTSFADVRAHTGGAARTAAVELGASAFTVGNDIAFASGAPDRGLVAHELAHVVQARAGISGGAMSRPGDDSEHEADRVAAGVTSGTVASDHVARYQGSAPSFGRAVSPARPSAPWGRARSTAPADAATVFRSGTDIASLTVTPSEIVANGKDTARATGTTNPAGKTIDWSFDGDAFGSTIDAASGNIRAGTSIAPEPKNTKVWVKATADTATKKAPLTLWEEKYKKALADYPRFIAGSYALPDFQPGINGNFDALYAPAARRLTATMRLKFDYVNDLSTDTERMIERVRRIFGDEFADRYASAHGMWTVKDKTQYATDFEARVKTQWSDRFTFQNVREPKEVWGKLGPVHVNLALSTVDSGEHFTVKAHKGTGRSQVARPEVKLYKGDLTPTTAFANSGADELARLNAIMPAQIQFDLDASTVKKADGDALTRTATYLRRATRPRFIIDLVGRSSSPGRKKHNEDLSKKRADAVHDFFVRGGATAAHQVTPSGAGETGATKDPVWQRVDLSAKVDPTFVNKLDTAGHEFGHMLGVGDEYGTPGDKASHWELVKKAFGEQYANDVALRSVPSGGSIMRGGEEVRIHHYVTFWQALVGATLKASLPDPKFGHEDWKFNG